MEKSKTAAAMQSKESRSWLRRSDSQSREEEAESLKAYCEGVAAANIAFGGFLNVLSKESKQRKK